MKKKVFLQVIGVLFSTLLFAQKTQKQNKAENLGAAINSSCYDYRPKLTADGNNLYFTRLICMDEKNEAMEGLLFYSHMKADSTWDIAQAIKASFNTAENSPYLYSVSPDNNQLLLTLKNSTTNDRFLCKVYRTANGWSGPDTIDIGIVLPELNSTFSLADNGRILIFSYEPTDKKLEFYGGKDLYVIFLQANGKWSKPQNLGVKINTSYIDLNPFLASDNKTLYFSSKQADTYGQNDLYMSKRLDNTWTNWLTPVNLGPEINDENWNDGFFIPAIGDYAYFNSERTGFGQGDIFRIKLNKEVKPDKVVLVQATVVDKKKKAIGGVKVFYENLASGELVGSAFSNPSNGKFQISLPLGYNYGIYAEKENYYSVNRHLDLKTDSSLNVVTDTLVLLPIIKGETILLNNLFFASNSALLSVDSYAELKRLARLLIGNAKLLIQIEGHTDNSGSPGANLELSEKRAKAVYFYLLSIGVKQSQLATKAFGETKPVAENTTEEGKRRNRRVDFTVLEN